jgi:hypothetical protein
MHYEALLRTLIFFQLVEKSPPVMEQEPATPPNVAVEWLGILLHIQVSGSDLGPEVGYPHCGF